MARDDASNGAAPRRQFSSWKQPGRPPTPDYDHESTASTASWTDEPRGLKTREERLATRWVELEQYRNDYRARKYAKLSLVKKLEMFGTTVMPIFVPLARGETLAMYEQRFTEWLWQEHRQDIADLKGIQNVYRERSYRIAFANANAVGDVMFDPERTSYMREKRKRERSRSRSSSCDREYSSKRKREREDDRNSQYGPHSSSREGKREEEDKGRQYGLHSSTRDDNYEEKRPRESTSTRHTEATKMPRAIRICDYEEPKGSPTSTEILKAHLACGCTACLFAAMGKMNKKLVEIEDKYTADAVDQQVVDLT